MAECDDKDYSFYLDRIDIAGYYSCFLWEFMEYFGKWGMSITEFVNKGVIIDCEPLKEDNADTDPCPDKKVFKTALDEMIEWHERIDAELSKLIEKQERLDDLLERGLEALEAQKPKTWLDFVEGGAMSYYGKDISKYPEEVVVSIAFSIRDSVRVEKRISAFNTNHSPIKHEDDWSVGLVGASGFDAFTFKTDDECQRFIDICGNDFLNRLYGTR